MAEVNHAIAVESRVRAADLSAACSRTPSATWSSIGSGIAGLSSAYEAARFGAKVIVIDRGDITGGMTARTTAHLVSEIDDRYFDLIKAVGEEHARLYHESQVAAINRIEPVCEDEGIDADFARLPGYLVAGRRVAPVGAGAGI